MRLCLFLGRGIAGLLLIGLFTTVVGCSRPSEQLKDRPIGNLVKKEPIRCQYAVYLPQTTQSVESTFQKILEGSAPFWRQIKGYKADRVGFVYRAKAINDVANQYRPPDIAALNYFGHGFTPEQAEQLQKCELAYVIDFFYPPAERVKGLRSITTALESLARQTGGLIWDESTREIFTPDEWRLRRIQSWTEEVPVVARHVAIRSYMEDETAMRAVTLGMQKFGLPDIAVEFYSWTENQEIENFMQIICQSIVENSSLDEYGKRKISVKELRNAVFREEQLAGLKPGATGEMNLTLYIDKPRNGDCPLEQRRVHFDDFSEKNMAAQCREALGQFFGRSDIQPSDDRPLTSRLVNQKLPILRAAVQKGLGDREFIELKVPLNRSKHSYEWIWVQITGWKGDRITGVLSEEPSFIPRLHSRQRVEVDISGKPVIDFRYRRSGLEHGPVERWFSYFDTRNGIEHGYIPY